MRTISQCKLVAGIAAAALILIFQSCGSSNASDQSPEASFNPGNYSSVVITSAMIERAVTMLDAIAVDAMERSGVPGMAIAVVHNDKTLFAKGYGVRSLVSPEPVDETTVFQLASLSKSVGATVVAGAVDDNKTAWDDPVRTYLPDFTLNDPYVTGHVTIADLYSHRSGLPDHAGDLLENIGFDRAYILSKLHLYPLESFRTYDQYTNSGLTAAAEAVAAASGMSWESLSRTRLYDRLGMNDTSSTYVDFMDKTNKALGHIKENGVWVPTPQQRNPDAQSPAGGVSSSVTDMAKWMRLLLNAGTFESEEIIRPEALFRAVTPHSFEQSDAPVGIQTGLPDARKSAYGLGIGVGVDATGRVRYSHSGAFLKGAATAYVLLPGEHLGIIVLTNGSPYGIPEAICASFMDQVELGYEAFDWLSMYENRFASFYVNSSRLAGKTPPVDPVSALPASAYTGTYDSELYGPATVTEETNGTLTLSLGPIPQRFRLSHWDANTFAYFPVGEDALGISAVDFHTTEESVASVTVEFLNEHGLGTFLKQ